MKRLIVILALALALPLATYAQHEHHDMGNMTKAEPEQKGEPTSDVQASDSHTAASADQQMDHHHMDMGPHMKLTPLRAATKADEQRAAEIVQKTRGAIEKYNDVKIAEADGYRMFLPNVKHQKMYHFTNYR